VHRGGRKLAGGHEEMGPVVGKKKVRDLKEQEAKQVGET